MPDQTDLDPLLPQQPNPAALPPAGQDLVRALLGGVGSAVGHVASLPKQMFEESENLRTGGDYNPAPFVETASMLAGGGAPAAEAGAAGIFGGKLAQGADLNKLAKAQFAHVRGATPEDIWHSYGWLKGPEGRWKYEIPDTGASASPVGYTQRHATGEMGESFKHPELYRAYPDMAKIPIEWDAGHGEATYYPKFGPHPERFSFEPGFNEPLALHEAQHAVQTREGFAPGSMSQTWVPDIMKRFASLGLAEKRPTGGGYRATGRMPPADLQLKGQNVARNIYERHAGEVEARNVMERYLQDRAGFGKVPPWQTQDIPYSQQIIGPPDDPRFKSRVPVTDVQQIINSLLK